MKFRKDRCWFCHDTDGLLHSICAYGIYGEIGKRIYYHPECLEMIQISPQKFGHKLTDKAIYITELRDKCIRNCNSHIIENYNKKVEKLQAAHFERMMPKK